MKKCKNCEFWSYAGDILLSPSGRDVDDPDHTEQISIGHCVVEEQLREGVLTSRPQGLTLSTFVCTFWTDRD